MAFGGLRGECGCRVWEEGEKNQKENVGGQRGRKLEGHSGGPRAMAAEWENACRVSPQQQHYDGIREAGGRKEPGRLGGGEKEGNTRKSNIVSH